MFLFPADAFSDFIRIVDAIRSNVLTIKTNRFDPAWKMLLDPEQFSCSAK